MWINAQFFDAGDALIAERGAYDPVTAILTTADTKVYEAVHTIDDTVAAMTGLPAGAHGHLAVNNVIEKDNRIPPIGFTNAAFASVLAEPVAATYADGQHWDDTSFVIPAGAVRAVVTVYYQTTSREFMDFLRDANVTNQDGQIAHDQWVLHGQSSPVDMDALEILFTAGLPGDLDGSGTVDVLDLLMLLTAWGPCPPPEFCEADLNNDGAIDVLDLLILLGGWS